MPQRVQVQPRNEWEDWLRGDKLNATLATQRSSQGWQPLTGAEGPRMPGAFRPNLLSREDYNAGNSALGKVGTKTPNAWYAGVPQMSFNEFISEGGADWFRREYAASRGLGEQTEQALARFSPLPQYWLAALGQDKRYNMSTENGPQRQADMMGQLYSRLLGNGSGYIDPKSIMQRIVQSTWNAAKPGKNDYMANLIANPDLDPDSQVSNFWNFVNGTVGRLMPQGTMRAYQNLIQRESDLYKDYMAKNPALSLTFNKWVLQRLGPTGGL